MDVLVPSVSKRKDVCLLLGGVREDSQDSYY
jgi:hypothetical protein